MRTSSCDRNKTRMQNERQGKQSFDEYECC